MRCGPRRLRMQQIQPPRPPQETPLSTCRYARGRAYRSLVVPVHQELLAGAKRPLAAQRLHYTAPFVTRLIAPALAIALFACAPERHAPSPLTTCRVDGLGRLGECGTIEVPEHHDRPDGPRIGLRVVRVPARGTARAA